MKKTLTIVAICLSISFMQGCTMGKSSLHRLTGELAAIPKRSSTTVEKFYADVNEADRVMYMREVALAKEASTAANPIETGTKAEFSDEELSIRAKKSKMLEVYCSQLDSIVSCKNGKQAEAALTGLSSQLQELGTSLPITDRFPQFTAILGTPVAAAFSAATGYVFGSKTEDWAKAALLQSQSAVKNICTTMIVDSKNAAGSVRLRAKKLTALYRRIYDKRSKANASKTELQAALADLELATKYEKEAVSTNPSSIFEKLLDVHEQLIQSIQSSQKEKKQVRKP